MESKISKILCFFFLAYSIFFAKVLGNHEIITCENLDLRTCAFAVSSSGSRCVLEKHVRSGGYEEFSCRNAGVMATGPAGWIESDECVETCGLDRQTVGISSDLFLNRRSAVRLCSSVCRDSCPNIVDLYANVAAGEGVSLSELCEVTISRREMNEILINSSGEDYGYTAESPLEQAWLGRN